MLPYVTSGNSGNPPILFLHGFLGSGADWREVAEQLSGQYFCILPDLPGHGSNRDLSNFPALNYETISGQLLALLDEQGIVKTHLVGYSMGGRIALYFAYHDPARILKLVLESASPGIKAEDERAKRRARDRQWADLLRNEGTEAFVEQWYATDLFASLREDSQRFTTMKALRKQNDAEAMATVIEALSPGLREPLWDRLPELQIPTLLIAGEGDQKYCELIERMERLLPDAARMVIKNAGHNVHFEEPGVFAKMMANFLKINEPENLF